MIRKLKSGDYRLYSRKKDPKTGKRRNLGTFKTREAAVKHEREAVLQTPVVRPLSRGAVGPPQLRRIKLFSMAVRSVSDGPKGREPPPLWLSRV
jgi:hypothetical protein